MLMTSQLRQNVPVYATMMTNLMRIPVNRYIERPVGPRTLHRCPVIDVRAHCWATYAYCVGLLRMVCSNVEVMQLHIPMPHQKGFGLLSRVSDVMSIWGTTTREMYQSVTGNRLMQETTAAFLLTHPTQRRRSHATHMMSKWAFRYLYTMILEDESETSDTYEMWPELYRILDHSDKVDFEEEGHKSTPGYVRLRRPPLTRAIDAECSPVLWVYAYLYDARAKISATSRAACIKGIRLRPEICRVRRDTLGARSLHGDEKTNSKTRTASTKMCAKHYAEVTKPVRDDSPGKMDFTLNPSIATPATTWSMFELTRMLSSGHEGAPISHSDGKILNLSEIMFDERREAAHIDVPVYCVVSKKDIRRQKNAVKNIRASAIYFDEVFVTHNTDDAHLFPVDYAGMSPWARTELYAGHSAVYYEAVRQVVRPEGAKPIPYAQRDIVRPEMCLKGTLVPNGSPPSNLAPVGVHDALKWDDEIELEETLGIRGKRAKLGVDDDPFTAAAAVANE